MSLGGGAPTLLILDSSVYKRGFGLFLPYASAPLVEHECYKTISVAIGPCADCQAIEGSVWERLSYFLPLLE